MTVQNSEINHNIQPTCSLIYLPHDIHDENISIQHSSIQQFKIYNSTQIHLHLQFVTINTIITSSLLTCSNSQLNGRLNKNRK